MTTGSTIAAGDLNQVIDAILGNRSDQAFGFGSVLTMNGVALAQNRLATPALPTLAVVGTAGTTSYSYQVVANNAAGDTPVSSTATITTGPAILNSTNYITITFTQVIGASQYKIIRSASGGSPATTGLIQTTTAVQPNAGSGTISVNDTGLTASAYTALIIRPPADLTLGGRLLVNGAGQTVPAATTNINANVSAISITGFDLSHSIGFNVVTGAIAGGTRLFTVTLGTAYPLTCRPVASANNQLWTPELLSPAAGTYDVYAQASLAVANGYGLTVFCPGN